MRRIIIIGCLILCCASAFAQADRQYVRKGNRMYHKQKFDKAEVDYRKATEVNDRNPQALYNLGCALMMEENDSAAVALFENAAKIETNKLRRSKSYHNIGVICQSHQMFKEAIEAYKESLRNNPTDDETRYNLALCQKQLKDQDDNQDNQNDNQDQDQDKQDQQQDQNKNQDKQDQNNDQDKQDQQQPPQEQMSKENAERMLQNVTQQEQEIQDRMQQQQQQRQNRRLQKNW